MKITKAAASVFVLLALTPAALAAGEAAPAPAITPGPVTWVLPPAAEVVAQTDEQKKAAQANGRTLPTPELLQPSLDTGLQPFAPTKGLKISKGFKAGSSDILPTLVEAWVAAFQKYHPGFRIEIDKPMAGSLGTLELIKGQVDFVFVSRELKPTDISSFQEKFGYGPTSVPISGGSYRHFGFLDSMAFIVHKDNPLEKLSFRQLDALMSTTRHRGGAVVRTWGDLGVTDPAWRGREIKVYGIKPWNGFEEFIRQRVLSLGAKRGEWREDIHMDPVVFPVARRVAADKDALGYTGLSVVDSAVKIIPVGVEDGGPFLAPSYENVADASYPLSRLVFLNTNRKPSDKLDPALDEFLRFILSREGQAVVREHGIFLPLRASQVEASRTMLGG